MKVYYECGACYLRQAKEALDLSTNDDELKLEIMSKVIKFLSENYKKGASSNATGSAMHEIIRTESGCIDPYLEKKHLGNEMALNLLPQVKELLKKDDSLENYVKISIVGNILDFGAFSLSTNIQALLEENLNKDLSINDIHLLDKALREHDNLLYLVDNTGEIVFDKLFLEKINKDYNINITVAVKESPVLNDACMEDAINLGLDEYASLTTIGTNTVGVVYDKLSPEFKNVFDNSDFIISKGMGNYEGLSELNFSTQDVFYLLCSKCNANAQDLGVNCGDMVLYKVKNI
jgi:uncharacterized protein with ATP-grasp and redox domains